MNNIFKALVVTAPAMAILFFYVVVKQSEHQALLERESARLDQEFAEIAKPRLLPPPVSTISGNPGNVTLWDVIQNRAAKEELEAQKRLEERRKKLEELEKEFEKALNETSKEKNLERALQQELKK